MNLKVSRKSGGGYFTQPFLVRNDIVLMSYVSYKFNATKDTSLITILIWK